MQLAIIGSRNFTNYAQLRDVINQYFVSHQDAGYPKFTFDTIISGGAKGADDMGAKFAKINNIGLREYIPDWDKHGKSAGFIRNRNIINDSDFILAFWDGISKGTANSLSLAKKQKKPTLIIYF